jgi:sulfotransferase family protein
MLGNQLRELTDLGRVFVVGCPRSGTTLVQAMLASHPEVFSFPETHFFSKLRGRFASDPGWVASPRPAWRELKRLARSLGVEDRSRLTPWHLAFVARAHERAFVRVVDEACLQAGKKLWVEKSPIHLHFIEEIASVMPDARFIHVLRNGKRVVSSFYRLCLTDPGWVRQVLPGNPDQNLRSDTKDHRVLDAVVDRWNNDVKISAATAGVNGHTITSLERLVAHPQTELERICEALALPFREEMLEYRAAARDVIGWRMERPHMRGPLQPLHRDSGPDLAELLPTQVRRVESRLLFGGDAERAVVSVCPDAFTRGRAA